MKKRINLLIMQHSRGLQLDGLVLERVLRSMPVSVSRSEIGRPGAGILSVVDEVRAIARNSIAKYDINLHIEDVKPRWLSAARKNWWVPNQEWIRTPVETLRRRTDLVLCKSRVGLEIFAEHGFKVAYTGFSTADRLDASVTREWRAIHVAGQSRNKGTETVVSTWKRHPEWPTLDVVWNAPYGIERELPRNIVLHRSPVDEMALKYLQNRAIFHICPSAVEGFGHTLLEGMSCGGLVIATDAPPMNELVTIERGRTVPWERSERVGLGTAYHVSQEKLTEAISAAFDLSDDERHRLCDRSRSWFLENDRAFSARLFELIASI